jgi:hypothetical protein
MATKNGFGHQSYNDQKTFWWPYEGDNPSVRRKFHVFVLMDAIDARHVSFHNFNCEMGFDIFKYIY